MPCNAELEERELPQLLGAVADLEMLDVGCGTGRWTEGRDKASWGGGVRIPC